MDDWRVFRDAILGQDAEELFSLDLTNVDVSSFNNWAIKSFKPTPKNWIAIKFLFEDARVRRKLFNCSTKYTLKQKMVMAGKNIKRWEKTRTKKLDEYDTPLPYKPSTKSSDHKIGVDGDLYRAFKKNSTKWEFVETGDISSLQWYWATHLSPVLLRLKIKDATKTVTDTLFLTHQYKGKDYDLEMQFFLFWYTSINTFNEKDLAKNLLYEKKYKTQYNRIRRVELAALKQKQKDDFEKYGYGPTDSAKRRAFEKDFFAKAKAQTEKEYFEKAKKYDKPTASAEERRKGAQAASDRKRRGAGWVRQPGDIPYDDKSLAEMTQSCEKMTIKTCFTILGVSASVNKDELKKQYRTLALKYHPDKYKDGSSTAYFQAISVAYKKLLRMFEAQGM